MCDCRFEEPGSVASFATAPTPIRAALFECRSCAGRGYGKCMCGLDERLAAVGLPPAEPHDPEAQK